MLEKMIWTEADFETMGWHDARLWAISYQVESHELLFDVDYIVEWVGTGNEGEAYTFRTAPATIVFSNVHGLSFDLDVESDTSIEEIARQDPTRPRNADHLERSTEWSWTVVFPGGTISFKSVGFTQYFRRQPIDSATQSLSLELRGGISFDRALGPPPAAAGDLRPGANH